MVSQWEGDGLLVWGPGCGKRRPEAWGVAEGKSVVEGIQLMGAVLEGRDPRLSGGVLRLASCSSRVLQGPRVQAQGAFGGHPQGSARAFDNE